MSQTVSYYLSLASPWTYLGSQVFTEMVKEKAVEVKVRPIDLGAIFPKTGGLPLQKRAPARQAYRLVELDRWQRVRKLPLNLHPRHFPVPHEKAATLVIAAEQSGGDPLRLAHALLRAVWADDRNIDDTDTLRQIARETGEDAEALLSRAADEDITRLYQRYTAEALATGVFGAPTYVIDDELFWGQDRLDFVRERLDELT